MKCSNIIKSKYLMYNISKGKVYVIYFYVIKW